MDAFAKATPDYIPVMQILAFRFGIQLLSLLPLALVLGVQIVFSSFFLSVLGMRQRPPLRGATGGDRR